MTRLLIILLPTAAAILTMACEPAALPRDDMDAGLLDAGLQNDQSDMNGGISEMPSESPDSATGSDDPEVDVAGIPDLDADGDGFPDNVELNADNPTDPDDPEDNPEQARDTDADGCSDFSEAEFGDCNGDPLTADTDGDAIADELDNCPNFRNPDQTDSDADGVGDECDLCIGGNDLRHSDDDEFPDDCDTCPLLVDPEQVDRDGDGWGDPCDNCPDEPNVFQEDFDGNGVGDACDVITLPDTDADGIFDFLDNCVLVFNPDQVDLDADGLGDACDPQVAIEVSIIAADGTFLGVLSENSLDPDSIANSFGTFGNSFNSLSIWNSFGTYGSSFSIWSPWNEFTSTPPSIYEGTTFVAYLTANSFLSPGIHPNDVAILVGRVDQVR